MNDDPAFRSSKDRSLYSKPEVLLGDLRGGLCGSTLCRQLRSVAADEIERLKRELGEVQKYAVERSNLLGAIAHQGAEIQRLRAALEQIAKDEPDYLAHAVARRALSGEPASAHETGNDLLEKARTVLASAYQAVGCLVHPELDIVPSEADQTRLLDMLSRWEDWSLKQVEEFLPWPKDWAAQNGEGD